MTDYNSQSNDLPAHNDTKDKKLEDGSLVHITATPTNDGTSSPITLSPEELAAYKLDRISAMTAEEISAYEIDPVIEAQVRWQYDKRILPAAFCMYFFSALDRGNLGNAKTDGFDKDIGLHKNQYNAVLTTQYVTFATFALFGGYLIRRFGPPRVMPIFMLCWGILATLNAAAKDFAGACAVRFFLGMFEGLYGPCTAIYLSTFYRRAEMGKRMAIYYSSTALSGAFSGLLAYAVFRIKSEHIKGWQILFIIEGGLTIIVASVAFFILPSYPQHVNFLTPLQKEVAVIRLLKDSSSEVNSKFDREEFFRPLKEWRFYLLAIFALTYGTAQSTATTFLPQIIGRFGYSTVDTNLLTVPCYVVATLWLYLNAWLSDRYRQRAIFLAGALATTFVGCVILAAIPLHSRAPGYFACFLIEMGAFVPTAMFHSWHNNNDGGENSRAFRTGALTFAANAGSLISSNIFLTTDAPKYEHALIASAALQVLGVVVVLGLRTQMARENGRRNREQGVQWTSEDVATAEARDPKSEQFRFFL